MSTTTAAPEPTPIRRARVQDIPAILAIIGANGDTLLPRTHAEYEGLIDVTWVAEHDGKVVGCATLEVYSWKIAEIRSVAVDAPYRKFGYGRLLIAAAVAEARARNILEIMVITSSPEYFRQLGFHECMREKYALFWNGTSEPPAR